MSNRLAWVFVVVSGLLLVGVLLYVFGTPTAGPAMSSTDTETSQPAATASTGGSMGGTPPAGEAVEGEAPPPDPSTPLAIEIPGCVCHSDDPEIVAEHGQYRMNQCAGCHMGETPTGQ